jgi:hypothetical protein
MTNTATAWFQFGPAQLDGCPTGPDPAWRVALEGTRCACGEPALFRRQRQHRPPRYWCGSPACLHQPIQATPPEGNGAEPDDTEPRLVFTTEARLRWTTPSGVVLLVAMESEADALAAGRRISGGSGRSRWQVERRVVSQWGVVHARPKRRKPGAEGGDSTA